MPEDRPVLEGVEEAAGEKLGIERWDRPAIFRDAAQAAVDADLPYWLVLLLSGAIATLGLALNSSAVVIGAMLIAPLLAPVMGLGLGLAVGDGRLALQTFISIAVSTLAVVAAAALLTMVLPFQTVTAEISARTRPTTLDLVIAVLSGLAGAVVTVARGHRLSAAIPGVAISVALIPPLGVTGFGIGAGMNWPVIRGSLLLYGANLAGIVLSGMLVFMLVGMHRDNVLETARRWHREENPSGLIAWVDRLPWVRSLGIIQSTAARVGLVLAFVVAVAVPLGRTLEEITREARISRAVGEAADVFDVEGQSSVISRQVVSGAQSTRVHLRVATAELFGQAAREEFERRASAIAGEPVRLVLEQIPATSGDVEQLAELLRSREPQPVAAPPPPAPAPTTDLLQTLRERLGEALETLPLPDAVAVAGAEFALTEEGGTALRLAYLAPEPLPLQAEQMISVQLRRALGVPGLRLSMEHLSDVPRTLGADTLAAEAVRSAALLLDRYPRLRAELVGGDTVGRTQALEALRQAGVAPARVALRDRPQGGGLLLRLRVENGDALGGGGAASPPEARDQR